MRFCLDVEQPQTLIGDHWGSKSLWEIGIGVDPCVPPMGSDHSAEADSDVQKGE